MQLVIVDIEADFSKDMGRGASQDKHTIEIGAALKQYGEYSDGREFSQLIVPKSDPIHPDCINLTGITNEELQENGRDFASVWEEFRWFIGDNPKSNTYELLDVCFCSWGRFDWDQLQIDCARHGVKFPFRHFCDLAKCFTRQFRRRLGHRDAMKFLGIGAVGNHHRGLDDVRNICLMLPKLRVLIETT